jgi:uncharacterized membrane protein YedE/YeeE
MELLFKPWPWYVAGPLIGLTVPTLLLLGNKKLGISSTLRQLCAACYPAKIPFFNYDWKKDSWNLFFAAGILLGGFLGGYVFANPAPVEVSSEILSLFRSWGIDETTGLMPEEIFNWKNLITGHGIMGLSALQWPSLVATVSFFIGGILFSHLVLPYILLL